MVKDSTAICVDPSNLAAKNGIVSCCYVPWTTMLEKMKEMNMQVNNRFNPEYALELRYERLKCNKTATYRDEA